MNGRKLVEYVFVHVCERHGRAQVSACQNWHQSHAVAAVQSSPMASPVVACRGISRAVEALSSLFLLMALCLCASAFVHGPIQVSIRSRCVGVQVECLL